VFFENERSSSGIGQVSPAPALSTKSLERR
jgi:hypothetical protein